MSVLEKVKQKKVAEDKRYSALSAVAAIAELDPHSRQDLICHLKALNESVAERDEEEQEYILKAICEIFSIDTVDDTPELERWEAEAAVSADGAEARRRLDQEAEAFFVVYNRLKAAAGLRTIRAVAEAAGLSPTTVHAIEQQRVKPQYRTLESLAKAFKVDVAELVGR